MTHRVGFSSKCAASVVALLIGVAVAFPATFGGITTVSGSGALGFSGDDGSATSARLASPLGVAVDHTGNLFIADYLNHRVRQVDATTGVITTVAGAGVRGFSGDGGPATSARLASPLGVAVDNTGNLFVTDHLNHRIRQVDATTGVITTVAGTGESGFSGDGGPATSARLASPFGVAVDATGSLLIVDRLNHRIRQVDAAAGVITTVAGTGVAGFDGDGELASSASLNFPAGVAVDDAGNLLVADSWNHRIRRVDVATGVITTVAGTGVAGFNGDDGPAPSGQLNFPAGVAVDGTGNLFIADVWNHRIRRVDATTGVITTVAGAGVRGFGGDGGLATDAALDVPFGVAVDRVGNLFLADSRNHRIRQVELGNGAPANRAPTAQAGADQPAVQGTSPAGSPVMLDGSMSSDPDGDQLTFTWDGPFGSLSGPVVAQVLPLGTHVFTLTVDDGAGGTDRDTVLVTVTDTRSPSLTLFHASVEVTAPTPTGAVVDVVAASGATATDDSDPTPVITHDGPVAPAEFPVGTTHVNIMATDASGNSTASVFSVSVLTVDQPVEDTADALEANLDNDAEGLPADEAEDALRAPQDAANELAETQPDNHTAVDDLEGAVNDLEAAVSDAVQDPVEGAQDAATAAQALAAGIPLAVMVGDALRASQEAVNELAQTPPDNHSALGDLQGAIGDLEVALGAGRLDPVEGAYLMDQLAGMARVVAVVALEQALAQSGDPNKINIARQALADGDRRRLQGAFKNAVASYENVLNALN